MAINVRSPNLIDSLFGLVAGRAWRHLLGHAVFIGASYLAIEPYVRRFWPRSLVGIARILDGRWRDSVVGKELLIGISAASLVSVTWFAIGRVMPAEEFRELWPAPPVNMVWEKTLGPTHWIAGQTSVVASGFLHVFILASICVLLRIVWGKWFAITLTTLITTASLLTVVFTPSGAPSLFATGAVFFVQAMLFFLFTSVGFLSSYVAWVALYLMMQALPLSVDSWSTPYAV